jgi:hypothetical protein
MVIRTIKTNLDASCSRLWAYWCGDVDGRPLTLFRIALSLILLKDAIYHFALTEVFYSDNGVLPLAPFLSELARSERFSLMDYMPDAWMAQALFMLWVLVLIGLLLGYRTRLMSLLNFVLILSIHERNPFILTGADTALLAFSFWLMFANSGQVFSLDAFLRHRRNPNRIHNPHQVPTVFALPVRFLQWQLIIIYVVTSTLKLMGETWLNGDAVFYTLQQETILLPLGHILAQQPLWVLRSITHYTLIAELLIPVLLILPFAHRYTRPLAIVLGYALHTGIGLTLAIPDFSLLMMSAYLLFLPTDWVKRLAGMHRNQTQVSETDSSLPPRVHSSPARLLVTVLILPCFALMLWWNVYVIQSYSDAPITPPPSPFYEVIRYSGIWQYWDLYAPLPIQYDGWFIVAGEFENGLSFDLLTGQFVADVPPVRRFGAEMRWEKLEENLFKYRHEVILNAWAGTFCRQYNIERPAVPGTRLARLQIQYRYRTFHAPNASRNPLQTETLWYHWCLDEYRPTSPSS